MAFPKTILNHPAVAKIETGDEAGAPDYKYWVYLKPEYHFTAGRMEACTGGAGFNAVWEFKHANPIKGDAVPANPNAAVWAKVKELAGWTDGDKIRFPSVYAKEQFEKWCATR